MPRVPTPMMPLVLLALVVVPVPDLPAQEPAPTPKEEKVAPAPTPPRRTVRGNRRAVTAPGTPRAIPEEDRGRIEPGPAATDPQDDGHGQGSATRSGARITRGWIPLHAILQFLESATERGVVFPSALREPGFSEEVLLQVLSDQVLTVDAAVAILGANNYDVAGVDLADGVRQLHVLHRQSRVAVALPVPGPDLTFGPRDPLPADLSRHLLVTRIYRPAVPDLGAFATALRAHFDIPPTGGSIAFHLSIEPNTGSLLLTAPLHRVRTVDRLVALLTAGGPAGTRNAGAPSATDH